MIPGVTFHPRSSWEPADLNRDSSFHRAPPPIPHGLMVDRAAVHYTGAVDIPDGDPHEIAFGVDGIRRLLAAIHRDWLTNRTGGGYRRLSDGRWFPGYPLGYSFAIDWLGGVWEGSGFDYREAATGGHTLHVLSVLMLTDRDDPGSELMWRSFRALGREARRRGFAIAAEPWAHGWFREITGTGTATACCGPSLKQQIGLGLGNLNLDDMEDTMKPINPVRAYDSRPTSTAQAGVDPTLSGANKMVTLAPFGDGEDRDIVVGLCAEAHVGITVIGRTGSGYVSVNDPRGKTSLIGFSPGDRVESGGAPVLTPNGKVNVSVHDGTADIAVDVYARG